MAIYHYSAQVIGRSAGRSAVACAAYRAGERLHCRETGTVKDYTRKDQVDETFILAPKDAPEWVYSREELWNQVHAVEKRKDAQLCREINVALPREIPEQAQKKLVSTFVDQEFVRKGMIADVCLHNLSGDNPHAHIMLSTRVLTPEGFGKKERGWNDKRVLLHQRESWAELCNLYLMQSDVRDRVDHRSLKAQGVDREPTIHLGSKPHSERVARNEAIKERNSQLPALKNALAEVVQELANIPEESSVIEEKVVPEIRKDAAEQRRREDGLLAECGVNSLKEAYRELNKIEKELAGLASEKEKGRDDLKEWKEAKGGLFSFFKNKRLDDGVRQLEEWFDRVEKHEEGLEKKRGKLEKARNILWERERPERERIERERLAKERREAEREKKRTASPLDDLDPKYSRELRKYNLIVSRRIDLLKELAAAPNAEIRDKMFAEMQKNLGRTKGRGQGR